MPKGNPLYHDRVHFFAGKEMLANLQALGFLWGIIRDNKADVSKVCRRLIDQGVKQELAKLDDKQKQEYKFILQRVKMALGLES